MGHRSALQPTSYVLCLMRGIRQRRVLALLACLAWLFGVEVLPAIHQVHHHDDHTHDASGAMVSIDHGDHHHEVAKLSGDRDHDRDRQLAIDHPVEPGHQAGGVAHHAVALHVAVPPQLAPIDFTIAYDELAIEESLTSARVVASFARGPPHTT